AWQRRRGGSRDRLGRQVSEYATCDRLVAASLLPDLFLPANVLFAGANLTWRDGRNGWQDFRFVPKSRTRMLRVVPQWCPFRKSHPAWESHRRVESSHDRERCSRSFIRSQCSSLTSSSPRAGLKPRTCSSAINSASP